MRRFIMRAWRRSPLRVKLTLLYTGLLGILIFLLGYTLYWDTSRFLIDTTALRVRAQAKPVIERWLYASSPSGAVDEATVRRVAPALARDLTSRDTVAVVLDKGGHVLAVGRTLPEEPSPPPPDPDNIARALAGENEVTYIWRDEHRAFLVLLIPLRTRPGEPHVVGVVQMSTRLQPVERILRRQRNFLLLAGFFVLLSGGVAGWWLTSTALKPLQDIVAVCRRVAAGDLSQRVPVEGEDEVGQLARAFNAMIDRLEQVFQAQQRFIANAAHELRTPLTALQGSLEVLLRGAQDDPAAVSRLSQAMYREVTRLNRLAEQLLDLSRLDATVQVRVRPVPLADFFSHLSAQAELLARDQTFILEPGPAITVQTDPDILMQVLFNLIANAIQHNDPGVTIRVGWEKHGNGVRIWVEDNGTGIPASELPHIFEPFYRGDRSRSRRRGGAGLGLALVKGMVEALGGHIRVSSEPGRGTRFEIWLGSEDES